MLAFSSALAPVAELACRHPLATLACFEIWLPLSLPFVAAGGAWSLLSLSRRRRTAPSVLALRGAIAAGFAFAFATATVLAVALDVFHLHASGGIEIGVFLLWVFAFQAGYVRLVFRLWRRDA